MTESTPSRRGGWSPTQAARSRVRERAAALEDPLVLGVAKRASGEFEFPSGLVIAWPIVIRMSSARDMPDEATDAGRQLVVACRLNGESAALHVPEHWTLADALRERAGLTGHPSRMRARGVWCVHRAARRRTGQVVHRARRPGPRSRGAHDRGTRRLAERHPPSGPAGVHRAPCAPVRLLHARVHHARGRHSRARAGGRAPSGSGICSRRTSAAAPATSRSSRRCCRPSKRWRSVTTALREAAVGRGLQRTEDRRLITGHGEYVADVTRPGQLWARIVRSPVAHGLILDVDLSDARALPGVAGRILGRRRTRTRGGADPAANGGRRGVAGSRVRTPADHRE